MTQNLSELTFDYDRKTDSYVVSGVLDENIENAVIPSIYNGKFGIKPVTVIGYLVFQGCTSLKSIYIPNTITEIGDNAFYGCKSLESIVFPSGVTKIKSYALYGCTSLTSVTIPNSVTEIYESTFKNCKQLKNFKIPSTVKRIERTAFDGCSAKVQKEYHNWKKYETMREFCLGE